MTDKPTLTVYHRFHQEKVAKYMGHEFMVPKDTGWLALEPYADASTDANHMLVAFRGDDEPRLTKDDGWESYGPRKVVAVVMPPDFDISQSLVKVD